MLPFKTIREQCDDDVVDDHLDSEEGKIVNLRHQDVLNNYMIPFILNQDQFRGKLLDLCQIKDVIEFENAFPKRYDSDRFDFVGSGSYAKVLRYRQTIMSNREQDRFGQKPLKSQLNKRTEIKYSIIKLINVHSERFAKNLARRNSNSISNYRNVYNEFRISQTLSELNDGVHLNQYRYQCGLFPIVNNCHLVKNGPSVDENFARIEHRTFDENDSFEKRSDNSMLSISSIEQYLCVKSEIAAIDMEDCGQSLDCLLSDSFEPLKILSSVKQIIIGLMIAEEIFEFEHRDLHFGNILWRQISDDYLNFIYQNQSYRIPSSNVHIKVIDTTFSRMKINNQIFYRDLSELFNDYNRDDLREELTFSDHQNSLSESYEEMANKIQSDWKEFHPRTNCIWLIYVLKIFLNKIKKKIGNYSPPSPQESSMSLSPFSSSPYSSFSFSKSSDSQSSSIEWRQIELILRKFILALNKSSNLTKFFHDVLMDPKMNILLPIEILQP